MFDLNRKFTTREGHAVVIVDTNFRASRVKDSPVLYVGVIRFGVGDVIQFYTVEGLAVDKYGNRQEKKDDLVYKTTHHIAFAAILGKRGLSQRYDCRSDVKMAYPTEPIAKMEWDECEVRD